MKYMLRFIFSIALLCFSITGNAQKKDTTKVVYHTGEFDCKRQKSCSRDILSSAEKTSFKLGELDN